MKRKYLLFAVFLLSILASQAKTKKYGTWIEAEISKDIFKKLEFSFKPEIRLQDDFSVDEYLFDGKFTYKPKKYLRFAAAYRLTNDVKNKGNEIYHRFAFDGQLKKEWDRLEGTLRLRWTNYAEFDAETGKNNYLRYRLKFEYDIKNCKIRPYTSFELFHRLSDGQINKNRFDLGASIKVFDKSRIGAYYRIQSYFSGADAIHIAGLSYSLSL